MLSDVYRVTSCSTATSGFASSTTLTCTPKWAFAHQSLVPGRGQLVSAKHQVTVTDLQEILVSPEVTVRTIRFSSLLSMARASGRRSGTPFFEFFQFVFMEFDLTDVMPTFAAFCDVDRDFATSCRLHVGLQEFHSAAPLFFNWASSWCSPLVAVALEGVRC